MRVLYLAPALLLTVLLAACSDTPDDDVIRDALNQELKQAHLNELFQVTDVETAGRYPEDDDHVALDVRYTMEAQRDLSEYSKAVKRDEERDAMLFMPKQLQHHQHRVLAAGAGPIVALAAAVLHEAQAPVEALGAVVAGAHLQVHHRHGLRPRSGERLVQHP